MRTASGFEWNNFYSVRLWAGHLVRFAFCGAVEKTEQNAPNRARITTCSVFGWPREINNNEWNNERNRKRRYWKITFHRFSVVVFHLISKHHTDDEKSGGERKTSDSIKVDEKRKNTKCGECKADEKKSKLFLVRNCFGYIRWWDEISLVIFIILLSADGAEWMIRGLP